MKHHVEERQEARFHTIDRIKNYDPRNMEPLTGLQRTVAAIGVITVAGILASMLGFS